MESAMVYALQCGKPLAPRHLRVAHWALWTEPGKEINIRNTNLGLPALVASDVLDREALSADLEQCLHHVD